MVQDTKVHTIMAKNMEMENLSGLTDQNTKESFETITLKERVNTHGRTEECMRVVGKIIKCMDLVCLSGQMGDHIMANTLMIRNMDLENFIGLMEKFTKGLGLMAVSMA